eukprot:CAMPEP_0174821710 /NCGR_PEP_ID=MMETSP1107-20130205/9212_1 /TAXON_ID=36770 /ORGANISM="Paraphysomonas vestita, Strain GFlagA" /LENGTH=130 /DNA_ID=CAMNT_0016039031 /DNA_START=148 /DNA_END=540 /DNA_ORIENTATION=-
MIEEESEAEQEIPLPNVTSEVLSKIIEFLNHFAANSFNPIEKPLKFQKLIDMVPEWYVQFIDLPHEKLAGLAAAANYLDIRPLLDLVCAALAIQIKGKTPDEIRSHFGVVNDFTPEEEAKLIEEHKWVEA